MDTGLESELFSDYGAGALGSLHESKPSAGGSGHGSHRGWAARHGDGDREQRRISDA